MQRKQQIIKLLMTISFALVLAACSPAEETISTARSAATSAPSSESGEGSEPISPALAATNEPAPSETTTTEVPVTSSSVPAVSDATPAPPTGDIEETGEVSFGPIEAIAVRDASLDAQLAFSEALALGQPTFEQALAMAALQDPDLYVGTVEDAARTTVECVSGVPPLPGLEPGQMTLTVEHRRQRPLQEDMWVLETRETLSVSDEVLSVQLFFTIVTPNGLGPVVAQFPETGSCALPRPEFNEDLVARARELFDDVIGPEATSRQLFWNDAVPVNTSNLEPGVRLIVSLGQTEFQIAEATADTNGVVNLEVVIPQGTPPGISFLRIRRADTGSTIFAHEQVVQVPSNCHSEVAVGASDLDGDLVIDTCDPNPIDGPLADIDGDLVLNGEDNCPFVPNPDQDAYSRASTGFACDPDEGHNPVDSILPFPTD